MPAGERKKRLDDLNKREKRHFNNLERLIDLMDSKIHHLQPGGLACWGHGEGYVCIPGKWPTRLELIPRVEYFYSLPGWDTSQSHGCVTALRSPVPIYTPT